MGSVPKIPTIDFSESNLKLSWIETRNKVCNALEDYSCFVVKLPSEDCSEIHNSLFGSVEELFGFPEEIKRKNTCVIPSRGYYSRGVRPEGFGINNPITNPDATDQFTKIFWPHGNPHFSENLNSFIKLAKGIEQTVTKMVFEHYGLSHHWESFNESANDSCFRLQKYQPAKDGSHQGFQQHTDMDLFTVIDQNQVNALEFKSKHSDQWIGLDASPNSYVFMTGDAFQVWSNDRIEACLHRVRMGEENSAVRYSVLFFTFHNGVMSVPEELVDEEHPLKYKPMNNLEYLALHADVGQLMTSHKKSRVSVKEFCGL